MVIVNACIMVTNNDMSIFAQITYISYIRNNYEMSYLFHTAKWRIGGAEYVINVAMWLRTVLGESALYQLKLWLR